jgi:hypothetical protein
MTVAQRAITVALASIVFLAADGADREPTRPAQKLPAVPKSAGVAVDPKVATDPRAAVAAADLLESAYKGERPPEAVRMLAAILRGSQMGPDDGWFGPAETRYTWKWLTRHYAVNPAKGGIPRSSFRGQEALFAALDRNKDGVITPDDLDWSDRNPYVQMSNMSNRFFRKLNARADGRLTKEELLRFFDQAAAGKDHLSPDDFRDALLAGMFGGQRPNDGPNPATLIRGMFAGDLGSMNEGPRLNDPAPDFTLKTLDGKDTIQLSKRIGPKPIVLVFGSFT